MAEHRTYQGSCHCGAIRFRFRSDELRAGIRCNCSICSRKGALMSTRYLELDELVGLETARVYRWGDGCVTNYFCARCGIHPFHDVVARPGHYRLNLGCIDGLDLDTLTIEWIDGRSF